MKATVSKEDLIAGISRTAGALPQRPSSMQVLQNILLKFSEEDRAIRSTATDLEIAVIVETPATVQQGGVVTVPGKKFLESVRELPAGEVSLSVDQKRLTLKSGRTRLTLLGAAGEEYPSIPTTTGGAEVTVDAEAFREAARKTVIAVSTDEARSFLTGAALIVNSECTRLVATDGHRLAIADFGLVKSKKAKNGAVEINAIIPRRILAEIISESTQGEISIAVGETNAVFTTSGGTYYSRLIAEKFPDYKKIIPGAPEKKIEIDRQKLADALRRVSPFSNVRTHGVMFSLKSDHVILSAETPEFGEAQDEVEASVSGSPIDIHFNSRYLIDLLKILKGDKIKIGLGQKISPAVFSTEDDKGYIYVLMPLRS